MGQYHRCPCIRVAADLGAVISCFLINCLLSHPQRGGPGRGRGVVPSEALLG